MKHWKLSAALLAGMSLAACEVHPAPQPDKPEPAITGIHSQTALPDRETQPQPLVMRLPDCGDGGPSCVTYDDGDQGWGMYLVFGTPPFTPEKIVVCDAEDYPTNLPCVLAHQDTQDLWVVLHAPSD